MSKKNNNTGSKAKRIIGIAALILAFVLVFGTLAALIMRVEKGSWTGWLPKQSKPADKEKEENSGDTSLILTPEPGEVTAMSYSIEPLTERAADGTVKVVKDSYTVTITYEPSYITGVKIDWSGAWADSGNSWASGKTFASYIGIEPADEYGTSARIVKKSAFGAQGRVTATAHNNPELKVNFVLDYVQSVTVESSEIGSTDFSDDFNFEYNVSLGTGTVRGEFEVISAMLFLTDEFETNFMSRLNFRVRLTSVNLLTEMTIKNSGITENGRSVYISFDGTTLDWSWFFPDWNGYTQNQKNAIYYSWFNTYEDGGGKQNIEVTLQSAYKYNGVTLGNLSGSAIGYLSGDADGSGITISSIGGGGNLVFY